MLQALPWLLAYVCGLIDNQTAKQRVTKLCFSGMPRRQFDESQSLCRSEPIPWHVRRLSRIRSAGSPGNRFSILLRLPEIWCEQQGIETISTRLEEAGETLTGNFATPNCYGPEKDALKTH